MAAYDTNTAILILSVDAALAAKRLKQAAAIESSESTDVWQRLEQRVLLAEARASVGEKSEKSVGEKDDGTNKPEPGEAELKQKPASIDNKERSQP